MCERCRSADEFLINHPPPPGADEIWHLRRRRAEGWQAALNPDMSPEQIKAAREGYKAHREIQRILAERARQDALRRMLGRLTSGQ